MINSTDRSPLARKLLPVLVALIILAVHALASMS
jgi:hypothetical protein